VDIQVIVTTTGESRWADLALERAVPSAVDQAPTVHHHIEQVRSLGHARNQAVKLTDPQDWICFLDADDEFEPGYIDAMRSVPRVKQTDLLAPSLRVFEGDPNVPVTYLKDRDMHVRNPCPIGTLIHRSVFDSVGGFWDEPIWEDFAMFQRAWLLGSHIRFVDDAVYRAYFNPHGHNTSRERGTRRQLHAIINANQAWLNGRSVTL